MVYPGCIDPEFPVRMAPPNSSHAFITAVYCWLLSARWELELLVICLEVLIENNWQKHLSWNRKWAPLNIYVYDCILCIWFYTLTVDYAKPKSNTAAEEILDLCQAALPELVFGSLHRFSEPFVCPVGFQQQNGLIIYIYIYIEYI